MRTPRRAFLRSMAAAPLLPAALAEAPGPLLPVALAEAPAPPPAPSPGPPPSLVAEALADVVRHRYGTHLEAGDMDEIRKRIEESLRVSERLRSMKLGNGDEPVTVFHARPEPPKSGAKR